MNVDLIGGSGFIGTALASRLLASGHDVRIIDKVSSRAHPQLSILADVRSLDDMRAAIRDGTVIVNLAAEHRDDVRPVSLYEDVNVGGARSIVAAAEERNVTRILFTSSVAVYGFAPVGTGEDGTIAPFNEYGRTKFEAEGVLRAWQGRAPEDRTLAIVRPTVVFGERNRGNVYNLLRQIASGRFVMVGRGDNRKSIAYVENVAAFLESSMGFPPGIHCHNYVDQPDFTMNDLVAKVRRLMGRDPAIGFRLPYAVGLMAGRMFDVAAHLSRRTFPISAVRVQKFCANSVYTTSVPQTGFVPPVSIDDALARTVCYEFLESHADDMLFYTE